MYLYFIKEFFEAIDNKPQNIKSFDGMVSILFDAEIMKEEPDLSYLSFLADVKEGETFHREMAINKIVEELEKSLDPYRYTPEIKKQLEERLASGGNVSEFMSSLMEQPERQIELHP